MSSPVPPAEITSKRNPTDITARRKALELDAKNYLRKQIQAYHKRKGTLALTVMDKGLTLHEETEIHVTTSDHHFIYKVVLVYASGVEVVSVLDDDSRHYAKYTWDSLMPYTIFDVVEAVENMRINFPNH